MTPTAIKTRTTTTTTMITVVEPPPSLTWSVSIQYISVNPEKYHQTINEAHFGTVTSGLPYSHRRHRRLQFFNMQRYEVIEPSFLPPSSLQVGTMPVLHSNFSSPVCRTNPMLQVILMSVSGATLYPVGGDMLPCVT